MKKKQWASGGSSPDWTDIEVGLRALDGVHGGKTGILISALGTGATGGLMVEIITSFDVVPGGSSIDTVTSQSEWPCKDCASLEGHLLGGLYAHDFAIGEAYQQRSFIDA